MTGLCNSVLLMPTSDKIPAQFINYYSTMAKARSKTEKKIDNAICTALTEVCESCLERIEGFSWITHQVNFTQFPASLQISCIFDNEQHKQQLLDSEQYQQLKQLIQQRLLKAGIKLTAINRQIMLDSEEACDHHHAGNWPKRLASRVIALPSRSFNNK